MSTEKSGRAVHMYFRNVIPSCLVPCSPGLALRSTKSSEISASATSGRCSCCHPITSRRTRSLFSSDIAHPFLSRPGESHAQPDYLARKKPRKGRPSHWLNHFHGEMRG